MAAGFAAACADLPTDQFALLDVELFFTVKGPLMKPAFTERVAFRAGFNFPFFKFFKVYGCTQDKVTFEVEGELYPIRCRLFA